MRLAMISMRAVALRDRRDGVRAALCALAMRACGALRDRCDSVRRRASIYAAVAASACSNSAAANEG